jgi:hypothetical protein
MRNTQLVDKIKWTLMIPPSSGSPGTLTATEVDGTGYSRCMCKVTTGSCVNSSGTGVVNSTLTFRMFENSVTGMSGSSVVTGGSLVNLSGATTNQQKTYILDFPVSASKPFLKCELTVGVNYYPCAVSLGLYRSVNYPVATSYATQAIIT